MDLSFGYTTQPSKGPLYVTMPPLIVATAESLAALGQPLHCWLRAPRVPSTVAPKAATAVVQVLRTGQQPPPSLACVLLLGPMISLPEVGATHPWGWEGVGCHPTPPWVLALKLQAPLPSGGDDAIPAVIARTFLQVGVEGRVCPADGCLSFFRHLEGHV